MILRENEAFLGGGIASSGTLTVNGGAAFDHNLGCPGTSAGGAIFNAGTMTLKHVAFIGNSVGISGGAIANAGVAALYTVTFFLVAASMHSQPGSQRWNPAADVTRDGAVDASDLRVVVRALVARTCV